MLLIVLAVAILVQVVTSGGAGAPPVGRPIAMTSAPSFPLGLVRILSCSELCGPFYFALVAAVLACGCETVLPYVLYCGLCGLCTWFPTKMLA